MNHVLPLEFVLHHDPTLQHEIWRRYILGVCQRYTTELEYTEIYQQFQVLDQAGTWEEQHAAKFEIGRILQRIWPHC